MKKENLKNFIKYRFFKRTKQFYVAAALIGIFTLVLGVSYSVFIISTNNNRASQMYIGNLNYGLVITNADDTTTGISGLTVSLNAGEEKTIKITLTSINEIRSIYKLQYKTTGNVDVEYIEPTNPSGEVGSSIDADKTVVVNLHLKNNDPSQTEVTFGAKGGYIHNLANKVVIMTDYNEITDKYTSLTSDLQLAIKIDGDIVTSLPKTGNYKLVSYSCENGSTLEWKQYLKRLWVDGANFPESCSLDFSSGQTLANAIMENNTLKAGTPSFANVAAAADTGLWKAQDDYGDSYYFRGLKTNLNNNVIFGGYQWKIIRITGSGDVKLIYNGVCSTPPCQINDEGIGTQIATSQFSSANNVLYMINSATNSTIKTAVDNWYNASTIKASSKNNLIADTIYCNDTTGTTAGYGAYLRLVSAKSPLLACSQKSDSYTKTATIGNTLLANPVGLITADEISIAGGVIGSTNSSNYLYTGQEYWTMSPFYHYINNYYVFVVDSNGNFSANATLNGGGAVGPVGVRPVITLQSTAEITEGNGSVTDPYVIYEGS